MGVENFIKRSIDNQDDFGTRLLKSLPTETIAVCLAAISFVSVLGDDQLTLKKGLLWAIFAVGLIMTPLYLKFIMLVKDWLQIVLMTIAFPIWMMTIDGPFTTISGFKPVIGSVLVIVYSLVVVPLLGLIVKNRA